MADVRSLLKSERAARRIQHKYASYSTTGSLLCLICHLQLKSESLWNGHLRSAGHIVRLQRLQEAEKMQLVAGNEKVMNGQGHGKKRKASIDGEDENGVSGKKDFSEEDIGEPMRKRAKAGADEDLSEYAADIVLAPPRRPQAPVPNEMRIPSRPATPLKPLQEEVKKTDVDEDEWAAFEAEIAAAEASADAVISAPAMSVEELAARGADEPNATRKERQELEIEADKEDAARKLEDDFEQMQSLEARVIRLKEKREMLRQKETAHQVGEELVSVAAIPNDKNPEEEEEEDEEEDPDDDGWATFRTRD